MKKLLLLFVILFMANHCCAMEVDESWESLSLETYLEAKELSVLESNIPVQIIILKNVLEQTTTRQSLRAFIKIFSAMNQLNRYINGYLGTFLAEYLARFTANNIPLEVNSSTVTDVLEDISSHKINAVGGTSLAFFIRQLDDALFNRFQLIRDFNNLASPKSYHPGTTENLLMLISQDIDFCGSTLDYLIGRSIDHKESNEKLKLLLKYGKKINKGYFLIKAIHTKNYKAIDLLADHDTINKKDSNGNTPIFETVQHINDIDMLYYLIGKGADITVKNNNGETLLSSSIIYNLRNKTSIRRYSRLIDFLIGIGLDINNQNLRGLTPLILSIIGKDYLLMNYILKRGGSTTLTDIEGRSALHYTIHHNLIRCVKKLIYYNANVNHVDNSGVTALILAAYMRRNDGAYLLINNKAQLDFQDNLGRTALLIAAVNGNLDLVQRLLEWGANASLPDKKGETIFSYLKMAINEKIISNNSLNGTEKTIIDLTI
jgi:ankyrin repeat protein